MHGPWAVLQGTAEEELLKVRDEQQQTNGTQPNDILRSEGASPRLGSERRRLTDREGYEAQKRAARNRVLSTLHRVRVPSASTTSP